MSDDFDKEAEREKLREKYERDQKKREATEEMSELLLKGATMTNAHCSECGDPIFRYDGQEFCPTCEKPVNRQTNHQEGDDEGGDTEQIEVTSPSDETRVAFGEEASGSGQSRGAETDATAESEAAETQSRREQSPGANLPASHERELPDVEQPDPAAGSDADAGSATVPETGASVTAARESLVRTLTRFSRLAEQTDDPRQAQEYLAAAREAAETIAELRR